MANSMEKSPSTGKFDYEKLNALGMLVMDNKEEILETLGVSYSMSGHMLYGPCPIHGGDRFNAWNVYDGGYWVCRTHNCQSHFKKTPIGMIRGILSHQKHGWEQPGDLEYGFNNTVKFILKLLKKDYEGLEVDLAAVEKMRFVNQTKMIAEKEKKASVVTRDMVRKSLQIPAKHYLDEGYSAAVLDKYDVGLCTDDTKRMKYRVVVPIYNEELNYIGCSGRSINSKCDKCNLFHYGKKECPAKEYAGLYAKWRHDGFEAYNTLYNLWYARPHIEKTNTVIIVESPGNVWRLEESGIHNSVATFGVTLNDGQKTLLDGTGALNIIVIGDNDEAGRSLCQDVQAKCQRTYRIFCTCPSTKGDIGEMSGDEVTEEIRPLIEQVQSIGKL